MLCCKEGFDLGETATFRMSTDRTIEISTLVGFADAESSLGFRFRLDRHSLDDEAKQSPREVSSAYRCCWHVWLLRSFEVALFLDPFRDKINSAFGLGRQPCEIVRNEVSTSPVYQEAIDECLLLLIAHWRDTDLFGSFPEIDSQYDHGHNQW